MCDGPLESYVLGTHEWRIEGDNVQCSAKGEAYTATLKLTGCREGEFTCYDGQCIRIRRITFMLCVVPYTLILIHTDYILTLCVLVTPACLASHQPQVKNKCD